MKLVAHGTAGHGAMPRMDTAIMHLGGAVWKIGQRQPPMNLTDVTRTYFEKLAQRRWQMSDRQQSRRPVLSANFSVPTPTELINRTKRLETGVPASDAT
jgi:hypothetical protein